MAELGSTFVVLGPDQSATPVAVTPSIYEELDRRFDGFRGHTLVSTYAFERDWPTWERHPAGDEVVVLLSGAAEFVLDREGRHESLMLRNAGEFVVVPKGTWHTARISTPTTMLFVTPGEGTENEERKL
jgi:mannose-6-phosphate isomerase-like protein (cupin superfamily)